VNINQVKKWLAFIIIRIFNRFPIKNNKVFLFSYYGAQFGCNPKYITYYINKHYPKDTFDIVWAFNDPKSKEQNGSFRKVKTMSIRYFYELCTAKVIITNFRTTDLFIKRKEQFYIQTWHSSLRLKQIEKDAENILPATYIEMAKKDSLKCDLLLSGCKFSTNICKQSFWYTGEIFEHGTPRNDILVQNNSQMREGILQRLDLSNDTKVLLYAPTFRKDNNLEVYNLDYDTLREKVNRKFGGKWIVLVKLHPHLLSKSNELIESDHVMNVTTYDDIQELLVVADILISDYSSLIFDYAITARPCFLYVPDLNEYVMKERDLYFKLTELPFIHATTKPDLLSKIDQYSSEEYKENITAFLNEIGSFEEGKASQYVLKRMEDVCFNEGEDTTYETV